MSARSAARRRFDLALRRTAAVTVVALLVDQLTKRVLREAIDRGDVVGFVPGLDLVHWRNSGIAFSSFADSPLIVGLLVLGAVGAVLAWFLRHADLPGAWIGAGLLVGGAVGNTVDRLTLGSVIDFLRVSGGPAFNLADVAIVAGALVLASAARRDVPTPEHPAPRAPRTPRADRWAD
ncbi:signal peptidase II [Patulibacter sp. NPDC049589]|uniref:signal peptidase II n=1 Tax=Patulibacter sp. NPDC049589 TaxID=3154731 RepID=UPI00342FC7A1